MILDKKEEKKKRRGFKVREFKKLISRENRNDGGGNYKDGKCCKKKCRNYRGYRKNEYGS